MFQDYFPNIKLRKPKIVKFLEQAKEWVMPTLTALGIVAVLVPGIYYGVNLLDAKQDERLANYHKKYEHIIEISKKGNWDKAYLHLDSLVNQIEHDWFVPDRKGVYFRDRFIRLQRDHLDYLGKELNNQVLGSAVCYNSLRSKVNEQLRYYEEKADAWKEVAEIIANRVKKDGLKLNFDWEEKYRMDEIILLYED